MRGVRLGTVLALAIAFAAAGDARADVEDFSTSFEPGQPQPTWTDTAERAANVNGALTGGLPGNVADTAVAVTASGENAPNESKERVVDGSAQTKWLTFEPTGWVQVELPEPQTVVRYALTSANDSAERDPSDWTLQGSDDGSAWTTLDTQTGQDFAERFQTREYAFANDTAYRFYRLDVTANHGDDILQLAELGLSTGAPGPPPQQDMRSRVSAGPPAGPNIKPGAGFTGLKALQYGGGHTGAGRAYSYNKVLSVDVPVRRSTVLSYKLFPELTEGDLQYPSTYAAIDLAFSDGTYLSELGHGPRQRGASKELYADQWNLERVRVGRLAAGRRITRILVAYDNPGGSADTLFRGWVDDIRIAHGRVPRPSHLSDWAITTRGTNSSGDFSRGNNFPATAVPHGFNFWTPVTNAGSMDWLYDYQRDNNEDNLPELEAFSVSHEPSPWMGDRQTFQVMPSAASGVPDADRDARALAFRHEDEIARPYLYGVTFRNGIRTELAPTDHAAVMRFTFPGDDASLIFDNVDEQSSLTIDRAAGTISGWSDNRSGLSNGAVRMYVYATFDQPMRSAGMLTEGNRPSTGYARFGARTVTMRVATSLISADQARRNLALEVGEAGLEAIRDRARRAWDRKLGAITVQGATRDQLTTLYSNLYRLNLYPNSAFENTGTNARPVYAHAMQSAVGNPAAAAVVPGKVYVNNGFWDTYRTAWPAYSLFYSRDAGELVDGFVQQFRDGGWIARWSSPGYANLMTGTSSDVAFADAYVKGVRGFDAREAYQAAVENATAAPPGDAFDSNVGRKGQVESTFLGYTPNEVGEGLSWSLEGYINDFGIANMAAALARRSHGAERRRYREEHRYFLSRAQGYVRLFDSRVGFFQGKSADGEWSTPPDEFDPRVWRQGGDYTETDGWNFAFHAPQDGQGLANIYGGRDGLAAKLDEFFATPETAKFPGTYGGVIHEMREARDVRMGQWGASNQVSHHIPYMYDYAGQPYKTQALVREATRRLFSGSEIGQGYPGDEDNGELSAWYLFSSLGFYPLQTGSPYYAVGSPQFRRAVIHLQNGRRLVVDAPRNSARNVYVQGMRLNGRRWSKAYLRHADLARGGRIEFAMGPRPSGWATGRRAAPPSITKGEAVPHPMEDAARPDQGEGSAAALFDDTSATEANVRTAAFDFDAPRRAAFYTLTSGAATGADPAAWVVEGSHDGHRWKVLDRRRGERFPFRSQTRPFRLARRGDFEHYRIVLDRRATLAEVELLSRRPVPANPISGDAATAIARPGSTATVRVTLHNAGEDALSGSASATSPDGWAVTPASAAFGPIAAGGAQTVAFSVAVPAGTEPGAHTLRVTARTPEGVARVSAPVQVVGDTIAFTPGTAAEAPWLSDPDGSQLDGDVHDGRARFADNGSHFTYRFDLPAAVTGATLTLEIGNEYAVEVSGDDATWRTVARETREIRDLSNLTPPQVVDLGAVSGPLYVRVSDAKPDDGWGGWLGQLTLALR